MKSIKLELTIFFAILNYPAFAQTEIGIRATPNITSQPKVVNPSPAYIYGENTISFDGGLDYTRMFRNQNIGLRVSSGIGLVDHRLVFEAPLNAFGKMTGEGNVNVNSSSNNYFYNSLGKVGCIGWGAELVANHTDFISFFEKLHHGIDKIIPVSAVKPCRP